jgi:hypothetical protein
MRFHALLAAASLWAGCSSTGDALVVVTVSATNDISGIESLQVSVTANGHTKPFTVAPASPPFSLPPDKTFAIDLPPADTGMFSITIDAVDANTRTLASGANSTTTSAGKRTDLTVTLGEGLGDGMNSDANLDGTLGDGACMTCAQAGYGCGTLDTCGTMIDCGPCEVTSVHPAIANTGDTLVLEGRFNPSAMISFPGGTMVAPTLLGPDRATVVVPATATAGNLGVAVGGTVALLKQSFRRASFKMTLGDFRKNYEQTDVARPMPSPATQRSLSSYFQAGQTVVLVGGTPNNGGGPSPSPVPTIEQVDVNADGTVGLFSVSVGRSLVVPRTQFLTYTTPSQIFVLGGFDATSNIYASVEQAQILSDGSGIQAFSTVGGVTLTTPRYFATGVVIGPYYYVLGGIVGGSASAPVVTNSVERSTINPVDGSLGAFEAVSGTLPTARGGCVAYVSRDKLYLIGGFDGVGFTSAILESPIGADGSLGAFTTSSVALTTDRLGAGAVELGNSLYVLGGVSTLNGTAAASPINTVELAPLTPASRSLGAFAAVPKSAMNSQRTGPPILVGNYLYFLDNGGSPERASIVDPAAQLTGFANATISLTMPRWGVSSAVVGNFMYLFGGTTNDGTGTGNTQSNVVRAPVSPDGTLGTFTASGMLSINRQGASVAVFGRQIYVCGGQNQGGKQTSCDVFQAAYDGTLTGPSPGPSLVNPRVDFQLAAINGTLYAIGDNFTTAEQLPLQQSGKPVPAANFSTSPPTAYPNPSPQPAAIVTGNNDYLIGGDNGGSNVPVNYVQVALFNPSAPGGFSVSGASLPDARYSALMLSTGSSAFLIGGAFANMDMGMGVTTNGIEASTITLNGGQNHLSAFSPAGNLVSARRNACGAVLGNYAYVIAGAGSVAVPFAPLGSIEQATIQ